MNWQTTTEKNLPHSITLQSTPQGYCLAMGFLLPNAEADRWQLTARRDILEAITTEGARQLVNDATIIEAQQAANAVAERKATAEEIRHRIAELQAQAEAAALAGDELALESVTKKIAAERLKLSTLESIMPTLEQTAVTAADQASRVVRAVDPSSPVYKRLQAVRAAIIAEIADAVQDKVQRLAIIEHQINVAVTDAATIKNGLNRKFVPTIANNSPPAMLK